MLNVNKISVMESHRTNQNKKISFQSKFVPNDALNDAFHVAEVDTQWGTINHLRNIEKARYFARIVDFLLNDGKDDVIKITRSKTASSLTVNGNRVNFYRQSPEKHQVDGERVINNIVDYYLKKEIIDTTKLTRDEFKSIKPSIDKLNSDLNADDATKNLKIYDNLIDNISNVSAELRKNTFNFLKKLESQIFNKK